MLSKRCVVAAAETIDRIRLYGSASFYSTQLIQKRHSHIGSATLYVPRTTVVSDLPFAPVANPTRSQPRGLQSVKSVSVTGPLGTVVIPVHEYVQLKWHEEQDNASPATSSSSTTDDQEPRKLTLAVTDSTEKKQRSIWGLTRALLSNAIEGVQEGHTVTLRLVGVGYRVAVETDPFPRPDKFQTAFSAIQQAMRSSSSAADQATKLGYFVSPAQRDFYAALTGTQLANATINAGGQPPITRVEATNKRLALRLGYSHPIYMPVPRGITCTTPAPTRIVLKGADKETLGLFASSIRRWRPPEPYKGKGVFVGDETIRIKAVRKK